MAKQRTKPNQLLVEGNDDKFLIPYLMDNFLVWGDRPEDWVVEIASFGGIEPLLEIGIISSELKRPNLQALGIIVDADIMREARWAAVSQRCRDAVSDFPTDLPEGGLIHESPAGLRVGVWIMPDNRSPGMIETFLQDMVPVSQASLWDFAELSRNEARSHGANYAESHQDKALIHTYLAWLEPPGQQLHTAMFSRSLHARSPLGFRFARWFIDLFRLPPRDPSEFTG